MLPELTPLLSLHGHVLTCAREYLVETRTQCRRKKVGPYCMDYCTSLAWFDKQFDKQRTVVTKISASRADTRTCSISQTCPVSTQFSLPRRSRSPPPSAPRRSRPPRAPKSPTRLDGTMGPATRSVSRKAKMMRITTVPNSEPSEPIHDCAPADQVLASVIQSAQHLNPRSNSSSASAGDKKTRVTKPF